MECETAFSVNLLDARIGKRILRHVKNLLSTISAVPQLYRILDYASDNYGADHYRIVKKVVSKILGYHEDSYDLF